MKKIVVKSSKGGVGKSVCSLNLAAALHSMGYRVLLVDFDFSVSSLSRRLGPKEKGVLHLLNGKYAKPLRVNEGFAFLPVGKGNVDFPKKNLKAVFKLFQKEFDFLIFDHSPEINESSLASLKWADLCLIPTYPDLMSMDGTAVTMKLCKELKLNVRILFNRVTQTRLSTTVMEQLRKKFPKLVLENYAKQRVIYAESLNFGTSAVAKNGLAAMDFKDVVLELLDV